MTAAGTNLYVANTLGDSVSIIDTSTQSYVRTIPVGSGPTQMVYLLGKLYVANSTSTSISSINTSKLLATISTGLNPVSFTTLANRYLYVVNSKNKNVTVIDAADTTSVQISEPKTQITVGNGPSGLVLVGKKIYVTNTDDGTVSVIDTTNNTVTKTLSVGEKPSAIVALGTSVFVTNSGVDTVSMIDTTTDVVKQTIKVGTSPISMTVSGTKVYVQNKDSKDISIIYTGTPLLKSFSTDTPDGTYRDGAIMNIVASFDQKLASGSTMTLLLNNGVELVLDSINDQQLSANYTV